MASLQVQTGLDTLAADHFRFLQFRKTGLLTHAAACDSQLRSTASLFQQALGGSLVALFGPEHGFHGAAQDLEAVSSTLPKIFSLYGDSEASLHPTAKQLQGIEILVIDLVDIGSRYYTFQATMLYAMEAAFQEGIRVLVLDRPNPIGGNKVEGPMLLPEWSSFVGAHPIPTRHGMTLGELAILYKEELELEGDLEVVPCQGWKREMDFASTGLPWVMPSPNMPSFETALVYPGMCLLEGTRLSEGRGATRPFELFGAPFFDAETVARELNRLALPGALFRPAWFTPGFQKHASALCGGAQLHVTQPELFQPVRAGLAILQSLRQLAGVNFQWRTEPYEFVTDRLAIDLLFGSDRERKALEVGVSHQDIAQVWLEEEADFLEQRRPYLLYPE
ncbi:MAG: DUF1343 domain-containing protein [Gemmataceae bacterium]|nr:DUF1343 domain-containing protein [Gemmataceae bacterium]